MKIASILKKEKKGKTLALIQALSIILSTIAFAYLLASTLPVVGAQEEPIPSHKQCVRVKTSTIPEKIIELPAGTTITQYCASHPNYLFCEVTSCPTAIPELGNLPIPPSVAQNPTASLSSLAPAVLAAIQSGKPTPQQEQQTQKPSGTETGGDAGAGAKTLKIPGLVGKFFGTKIPGFKGSTLTIGELFKTAAYAATIYGGMRMVLGLFGASPELSKSLSTAVSVGFFGAQIASKIGLSAKLGSLLQLSTTLATAIIGFGIGILIFLFTFKQTRYDLYAFTCNQWDAPTGGKYCEECNKKEDFPCTEYICKSLGQACELENPGTGEEVCVWKNRGDVTPPVIQPWTETLTTGYKYFPDNTISPPDRGVRIVPENANNGCVAPFTPVRFGVTLNEAAKCKIDFSSKRNFEEMSFFFGGSSTSKYNHSQTINLPSPQALAVENVTIEDSGEFTLYSRCQDANGNANTANFVFKFCLDEGPDTTPPLIVTTSILNEFPIAFGQNSIDLDVFVNEPAECRWSRVDKSYDDMENQMACNTNVLEFNAQMLYQCGTNLTGLNDRTNNDFYFRCLDQPHLKGTVNESDRNANTQSYKFTLIGTQPLVIDSVKPNGTIKDSTDIIKVTLEAKTSAGFKEGEALCYFSETGDEGSYVQFFTTGTHEHSQDLFLPEGDYTLYIRCTDLGGNTDTKTTSFTVESDSEAPIVARAFREENFLKIITNEKASCVYSTSTQNACNYLSKDGIAMQSLENNKHQIAWDPDRTFYIKCEDEFGNQPLPNECSIIARPFGR